MTPRFSATFSQNGFAEPDAEIKQLERSARAARARNAIIRANKERWAIQTRESLDIADLYSPYLELLTRFSNDGLIRYGGYGWSATQAGSLAPLIRSEQDLNILRIPSRVTAWTNTYAQALRRGITNYAIGEGFTYTSDVEGDAGYPGLKEAYQRIIDEHLELNCWGANGVGEGEQPSLEVEAVDRYMVDGEPFLREHRKSDGTTEVRVLHPGQVTKPDRGDLQSWSYGILTERYDAQKPLAYNVRYGTGAEDDEEVCADDIIHIKNNVWRDCKRGLPDFVFGLMDSLRLANILRGNLGDAAAQQAAIVGVEQREMGTVADWGADNDAADDVQGVNPYTGAPRGYAMNERGQWKQVPKGFTYAPGPGSSSAADKHMMVLSMLLRGAINKYHAPDWLITGDPSVANYATSLTVNSGFVQSIKGVQKQFRGPFRTSVQRAVEWRIRCMGRLPVRFTDPDTNRVIEGAYDWREVIRVAKVKVTCPDPVSRDPLQLAQQRQIELGAGVLSRQQWAAESGRDIESIMRENEEYHERFPETGTPLVMPSNYGGDAAAPSGIGAKSQEAEQSRGQPDNAGQFGPGGGGKKTKPKGDTKSDKSEDSKPDPSDYKGWRDGLNTEEKQGIKLYTNGLYNKINGPLRHGIDPKSVSAETNPLPMSVARLDSALAKAEVPKPITVYRGMEENFGNLKVGTTFVDKGYVSTSIDRQTAQDCAGEHGYVMEINVPKGAKGAMLTGLSANEQESELLLHRNSTFKVTGSRSEGKRTIFTVELQHG